VKYTAAGTFVAKKYATAFLNSFFSQLTCTDIVNIEKAQKFLQDHQQPLFFLQLPQFNEAIRLSMVEDFVSYFSLSQECIKIFLLLISHNRSFLIPEVLSFIMLLYKERMGIIDFCVKSSHSLKEQQKLKVKKFLDYSSGKKSMCTYIIDKKLIAGMRMQSVGYMWEYSVRKQLLCLRALEVGTNR
jgi:F0F1-type ATP synthase delta subunit